jgi:hypothetical protein
MTLGIVVLLMACGSDDPATSTNSDGATANSLSTMEPEPVSTMEASASQNAPLLSVWPSGEEGDGALATGVLTITDDACVYLDGNESGLMMLLVVPEGSTFDAATQTIDVVGQTFANGDVVSAGGSPRVSTDIGPQCTDAEGYFFADTVFVAVN